jgi:thioesterase domain-containing protein/acyl carrier protein
MDANGRVLVAIERFTMLRLRDKGLFDGVHRTTPATARPRAVANKQLSLGVREGIGTADGLEALWRVLSQSSLPQVVVSPQHLDAMLAAMRRPAAGSAATGDAASAVAADGRAPRTETEKTIAAMWGELLGITGVGLDDNFFDLGGHSLLAVQVINKLKKRTGKPLALTALLEAPTVEALAALIDPEGSITAAAVASVAGPAPATATAQAPAALSAPAPAAPVPEPVPKEPGQVNRSLVTIRRGSGGDMPPLFFVHDGLGETLLYRTLAHLLDAGPTMYGLQPAQRADGSYIHTHIVDMAAAHVRQVRAVQPHGPYYLTGLCAGGVISMEMAWQLEQAGETVAFVGIMDAADVKAAERPWRGVTTRWQRLREGLAGADGVGAIAETLLRKTTRFVRYQVSSRLQRRRHERAVAQLREGAPEDAPPQEQAIAFLPMYEVAHREHEPQGALGGAFVALYRATKGDGTAGDEAYADIYSDDWLGWQPRVANPIAKVEVPGGHSSLLQEPHVKSLARAMQAHLEAARQRSATAMPSKGSHETVVAAIAGTT